MTIITITARRWIGGWELWHEEDCWTQVATLSKARQQVIDYLDTIDETTDHSHWDIRIIPQIEAYTQVETARRAVDEAAQAQKAAAELSRRTVLQLRREGLSVSDIATIMGVSRGRVSQLAKTATKSA